MDWFFLLLNVIVSTLAAGQAGGMWAESQAAGGGTRLIAWGGALQATAGFVVAVPTLLFNAADFLHLLPASVDAFEPLFDGLNQTLPFAGAGVVAMIEAWRLAFRDKTVANLDTASAATLDTLHKLYAATAPLAGAFGSLSLHFTPQDDGGTATPTARYGGQLFALIALVLVSGFFLARGILMYYANQAGKTYVIDKRVAAAKAA